MFDPPKNFTCVPDAAAAAELERARDAVLKHSKALYEDEFLHQGNYTRYKYALNLPGQTSGSYSRNLNHLWSIGAGVLLWDSSIVEWYYPALTTGETHVAVNRSTAIPVLDRLEGDMKEVAKLVAGAQRVHGQHMCARCIAQYWRDVFAAIRARVRYDLVLDDKTKVLAVVEAEGACDVYHEVAVSFPADDKHNYHGSIAYYKNHKPTVSRGVGLCDWLRRERKQEKVRVVR